MTGRQEPRPPHRPLRRRVATSAAGALVLTAALGAGYALGGGSEPPPPGAGPFRVTGAELVVPQSCDALLDSFVERALEQVGAWGWQGHWWALGDGARTFSDQSGVATATAATDRATSTTTGTNVQEEGADEPDGVKAGPRHLFRLDDGELMTYDVSGDEPRMLARVPLDLRDGELLLSGDRLVVLDDQSRWDRPRTRVLVVDVADPAAPVVTDDTTVRATLTAARLHGDVVRLVVGTGLPELDFVHPSGRRGERSARAANEQVVRGSTLADWLPRTEDGEQLVDCDGVALPDEQEAPLGTVTVLAFRPADGLDWAASAVATSTRTAYFSTDRLYLATTPSWGWCCVPWGPVPLAASPGGPVDDGTTRLYAFALEGVETRFVASGEVDGWVRDRWAMDSVGGTLRVAVSPTTATGDFNSVVTLVEEGPALVEAGRVDHLGPGEEIKSVRWFDDLAVVVTFRQVDPLYAVDLTDPAAPVLLGELKIPGFSEYLHPLGSERLIGIGQHATAQGRTLGAQAALFDVSDLTSPRQLDVLRYGEQTQALAGWDPRQFTWLPEQRVALTVVSSGWTGRTGWLSVLRVDSGELHNRMVEVEHGNDVSDVRTVPLPSGQVALVTGDEVSFLEL